MSRYPRSARSTLVKCIRCNAPATENLDGQYICVECGDRVIDRRPKPNNGSAIRIQHGGISVRKRVHIVDEGGIRVEFLIRSSREEPTAVKLIDRLPGGISPQEITVSDDRTVDTSQRLESELLLQMVIDPGEVVRTSYVPPQGIAESRQFEIPPEVVLKDQIPANPAPQIRTNGGLPRAVTADSRSPSKPPEADQVPAVPHEGSPASWPHSTSPLADEVDTDRANEQEVVVGIPAYNEAATIGSVVILASQFADEVVVVDDGSNDMTALIAEACGATVLSNDSTRGKGASINRLFEFANTGDWGYLVCLDGDWQHDPTDIPKLLASFEDTDADVILGSRYMEGARGDTPAYRRVGQWLLDRLTSGGFGINVSDSQSGFRAFNRKALESIEIKEQGFGVESQMLSSAVSKGLTIEEVPISVRYDVPSPSTLNPVTHGLTVARSILRWGVWARLKGKRSTRESH